MKVFAVGDAIVIVVLLSLAFGSAPFLFRNDMQPKRVEMLRDNRVLAVYPLDEDRTVEILGANGPMSICIEGSCAKVIKSNCPCGICMKSAPLRSPGSSIICVPNHIIVRIPSRSTAEKVDAIAQ